MQVKQSVDMLLILALAIILQAGLFSAKPLASIPSKFNFIVFLMELSITQKCLRENGKKAINYKIITIIIKNFLLFFAE